jgi:quercetin dioxygenase-like cupin family protein
MTQPNVNIGCVSNLFVRQMHFASAGDMEMGHQHSFDHMTLLAKGKLKVRINDEDTEFTAPQIIFIKANLQHELTALSENTVAYCIHALRDNSTGDILDPAMVPKSRELYQVLHGLVVQGTE